LLIHEKAVFVAEMCQVWEWGVWKRISRLWQYIRSQNVESFIKESETWTFVM